MKYGKYRQCYKNSGSASRSVRDTCERISESVSTAQQASCPCVPVFGCCDMAGIWAEGVGHKLAVGRLTHSDEHAAQARLEIRVGTQSMKRRHTRLQTLHLGGLGWARIRGFALLKESNPNFCYFWFCLAKRVKPKFWLLRVMSRFFQGRWSSDLALWFVAHGFPLSQLPGYVHTQVVKKTYWGLRNIAPARRHPS